MKHLILSLLLLLLASSCKKQEGCTDSTAINYDVSAERDDGSCLYTTGCTDATAINYNADAPEIISDISCVIAACLFLL